jgi:RNA polymerase sigma factor (sigma-70 family)
MLAYQRAHPDAEARDLEATPDLLAEQMVDQIASRVDVVRALSATSIHQRRLVTLRYLADQSTGSIASALGVRETTVRVQLHRARNQLRGLIEPDTE